MPGTQVAVVGLIRPKNPNTLSLAIRAAVRDTVYRMQAGGDSEL